MNEQTEKNVNEAIDWLQQVGGSVQDFAVEQAPLYCREVVAWTLWANIAGLATFVVVTGVGVAIFIWMKSLLHLVDKDGNPLPIFGLAGAIGIIIAGSCNLWWCGEMAIKAAVAPRLVIVEHLRGLK